MAIHPSRSNFWFHEKKPKKQNILHVPGSSVDSENISRENIFATSPFNFRRITFVLHLLFLWTFGIVLLSIYYYFIYFLGSKFDFEQKSIPVNFHKK